MSNTFTLDNIRAATRQRYEPVTVELDEDTSIELPSLLRLGQKDRDQITETLSDIRNIASGDDDELGDDESELIIEAIGTVLKKIQPKAKRLLTAIEEEELVVQVSILTQILNGWIARTQVGEA